MQFGFEDYPVPFVWNESNPAFSSAANALSFFFLAVEKVIVAAVHEAMPLITDPAVAEEARDFVHQEGHHTTAHRQHVKGLIKTHPGLQETLDELVGTFDELTATKPLKYRLAYVADLEATFTPAFKLLLDNADTLFAPGDDRVASMFLWHCVEEVEHRSSALMIYDAVVADKWYRMRVAPSVFAHAGAAIMSTLRGFNKNVPLADRKVDALWMDNGHRWKRAIQSRLGSPGEPGVGPCVDGYKHLRFREQLAATYGIVRSQIPGHDPESAKLPAMARVWHDRYNAGYDVTRWYTASNALRA